MKSDELQILRARVAVLEAAVRSNHSHHIRYCDDYGGYPGSELCLQNQAALMSTDADVVAAVTAATTALEYYAVRDHYEPTQRLTEVRPPGVLVEGGEAARSALALLNDVMGVEIED